MGVQGAKPLENPIKIIKENPPPAPAREWPSLWSGRGRGQGVGFTNLAHPAGETGVGPIKLSESAGEVEAEPAPGSVNPP